MTIRDYYLGIAKQAWAKGERLTATLINNLYRVGVDPVSAERAFFQERT
jgi:hypothetical protein